MECIVAANQLVKLIDCVACGLYQSFQGRYRLFVPQLDLRDEFERIAAVGSDSFEEVAQSTKLNHSLLYLNKEFCDGGRLLRA